MGALDAAGAEQQSMTMLRAQGVSAEDRAAMRAAAVRMIEQVPGSTLVEAIGAIRETRMALGPSASTADVTAAAPEILRSARLSAATGGRTTAEGLRPLARFSAITGGFTDDEGNRSISRGLEQLRILQDAITAFSTGPGEGIDPREWEGLAKQGGIALRRMSPEGQAAMATLVQERGGQRTGTELTAFSNFVVNRQGPKKNLALAEELGLRAMNPQQAGAANVQQENLTRQMLAAQRITEREAEMIRHYRIAPGEFRGRGFAAVRPDIYTSDVLRPQLAARGNRTEEQQLDRAAEIFPRETSRRFVMAFLQVREVMEDILAFSNVRAMRARGENPTGIVLNEGYTNAQANVTAAYNTMLTELGQSPQVVALFNEIALSIRQLAATLREDGTGLNVVIGSIRTAFTDLSAVFGTTAREIEGIKSAFESFKAALGGFSAAVRSQANGLSPGTQGFIRGFNERAHGFGEWADGIPGRLFGPRSPGGETPAPAPGVNPDAAPMPPSWGGPAPRAGQGSNGQRSSFEPMAPGSRSTTVNTALYLDGRQIAEVVTRHQGRAATAPTQGPDRYDRRQGGMVNETVTA
jgi:hypothetical protein